MCLLGPARAHALIHLDSSRPQRPNSASVHVRCRIANGDHDPLDPSLDDRLGTWGSPTSMATRLERDVERSPASGPAGLAQRDDLGVCSSSRTRPTRPDDRVLLDDNCAHTGIRISRPLPRSGQTEGSLHEDFVGARSPGHDHRLLSAPIREPGGGVIIASVSPPTACSNKVRCPSTFTRSALAISCSRCSNSSMVSKLL